MDLPPGTGRARCLAYHGCHTTTLVAESRKVRPDLSEGKQRRVAPLPRCANPYQN